MDITVDNICDYNLNDLIGKELYCECGKTHSIDMKEIVIKSGAIKEIPRLLEKYGYKKVIVLSDEMTWNIAAKKIVDILDENGIAKKELMLKGRVCPDEKRIGEILINMDIDADIIIAIGTGVICDIGKFMAAKLKIELMEVVTAPSVDGFASRHAALVVNDLKTSYDSICPNIIIGDTDILKNAPMPMIIAGWCDIMGKYSALSDWKISNIVNNEYYCPVISKIVENAVEICKKNLSKIKERDDVAIQSVMEALILTGIAMGLIGTSRPASGSEHHFSHCWEMRAIEHNWSLPPHGVQVGVGEAMATALYSWLLEDKPDFCSARDKAKAFDELKWEGNVEDYFGLSAEEIIKKVKEDKRYMTSNRLKRIDNIEKNWMQIKEIIGQMPSHEHMCEYLKIGETAYTPNNISIDAIEAAKSVRMAKEVRDKYTILGLLDDLNLLEEYAERIERKYSK